MTWTDCLLLNASTKLLYFQNFISRTFLDNLSIEKKSRRQFTFLCTPANSACIAEGCNCLDDSFRGRGQKCKNCACLNEGWDCLDDSFCGRGETWMDNAGKITSNIASNIVSNITSNIAGQP